VAPQCDEIFKQKINDCSAYNIVEVRQFPRNSVMEFQNICNEMVAPFFCATLYIEFDIPVVLESLTTCDNPLLYWTRE